LPAMAAARLAQSPMASSPASRLLHRLGSTGPTVGAGLPAMAAARSAQNPMASSPAAGSYIGRVQPLHLWELACQRWRPQDHRKVRWPHRQQAGAYAGRVQPLHL
jgi:hypothetical protein